MLHVLESHPPPGIYGMEEASDPKWTQRVEDAARDELQEWHETLQDQAPNVHARLESGEAAAVLLDYAEENDVDLLILGSHGRTGVERFLLGSTTEKVIRSAPCPVLVVKPSPRDGDSD
jgi:nucleotide-binding universal stress UspA family protein